MIQWVQHRQLGQIFLAMAMLCALSVRIMVPVGYMPAAASGKLVLQLCAPDQQSLTVDITHKGAKYPSPHKADKPCLYAAGVGHGMLDLAYLQGFLPILYSVTSVLGTAIAHLTPHRLAAPPPPAIGPPLLR